MAPIRIEGQEQVIPGVCGSVFWAAMDQDGTLAGGRNFKLTNQTCPLNVVWCAFVVVVEADFATGNHFRLGEKAVELSEGGAVGLGGVVGVDSRAGIEPGHAGLAIELAA